MLKNSKCYFLVAFLGIYLFFSGSLMADNMFLSTWKKLSWLEQAQCGTSVAKAMVDIMKSSSPQSALRPFLFWTITLADDGINCYNSWRRKDQEFYSTFWFIKDLVYAIKDLAEEPSLDDLDLIDEDDPFEGGFSRISLKKLYPCASPLIKMAASLYCIIQKEPECHKKRVIAQGIKSLIRCGRFYLTSADKDKKSFETKMSSLLGVMNLVYLGKNIFSEYPAQPLVADTSPATP